MAVRVAEGERQDLGLVMAWGQGWHRMASEAHGLVTWEKRQVQPGGEERSAVNRLSLGPAS